MAAFTSASKRRANSAPSSLLRRRLYFVEHLDRSEQHLAQGDRDIAGVDVEAHEVWGLAGQAHQRLGSVARDMQEGVEAHNLAGKILGQGAQLESDSYSWK